ncbi:uncharacterized protein LOC131207243 [Anopheles bellator]|uniref:uncharacterized protein LOC131207243 n=1 Tax=Anopheles bellator TaxID=139047 RepID=UPI002647555A|nr:uncharacterized protein LOC131207243 [Anopheles bellator]
MRPSAAVPWLALFLTLVVAENGDITSEQHRERVKRWLSYPINGGLAKMVFGIVVPIRFHHPLPRIIVNTYNMQAAYRIPANIIDPRPETIFMNRAAEPDASRGQLFRVLERTFDRADRNGRACVLRAVCEVAATPLKHNGLIGEIIDVIFTPNPSELLDIVYLEAQNYGSSGRDCIQLYPSCPSGKGIFDSVSVLLHDL